MSENATARVLERAKELADRQGEDVTTLSTGFRVKLKPVSSILVEDCKEAIPEPQVPKVWISDKEREEENPNDPTYLAAVEAYQLERGRATFDALILFGVEPVDPIPEPSTFLNKLHLLERLGRLNNLKGFDLDDPMDLQFLFLRYVAFAGADLRLLSALHGLNPLGVSRARASFLGDETGDTTRGISSSEHNTDTD